MKKTNKKGFTIVELVIVIAVIAILSAVLIPTFGTVISDAQRTAAQEEANAAYKNHFAAAMVDGKIEPTELEKEHNGYTTVINASGVLQTVTHDKWTITVQGGKITSVTPITTP